MEKEQVIENLKQRVGENDFSDRSFDEFVTPLLQLFADDTKITEETWTPLVSILKTSNGQNRHSVAEGIKAGLAEKEGLLNEKEAKIAELQKMVDDLKKSQTPPTPPTPPANPNPNDKPNVSPEMQALLDKIEADRAKDAEERKKLLDTITSMQQAQQQKDTAAKIAEYKSGLLSFLKDSKATNEAVMNLAISDIEIKADSKIADLQTLVKAAYEKRFKEFYPGGGAPFGGNGGGGNGGSQADSSVKSYIQEQAKLAHSNAQYAENLQKTFK